MIFIGVRSRFRSTLVVLGAGILLLAPAAPAQADQSQLLVWNRYDPATNSTRLVVGRPDGSRAHDLTTPAPGVRDTEPVRSPDGQTVVFNREAGDSVEIAMVSVARPASFRTIDTRCSQVTDCFLDINPRFARDGRHLVFTRVFAPFDSETGDAAAAPLYISNRDGSGARRLSNDQLPQHAEDTVPRYSPDGSFIVFVRDQRVNGVLHFAIHRMNADGSQVRRLTPWELDADRPAVSPSRHGPTAGLIAFETHGGVAPTQGDVVTIPADCPTVRACTAALRPVTRNADTQRSSFAASWSPDGRRIAFADQVGDGPAVDVWTADWTGGRRHRVTDAAVPQFSPAWTY